MASLLDRVQKLEASTAGELSPAELQEQGKRNLAALADAMVARGTLSPGELEQIKRRLEDET